MKTLTSIIFFIIASPVFSEDARQLSAHEHGISALNIAIEAPLVVMEFHAPGADIVGMKLHHYQRSLNRDIENTNAMFMRVQLARVFRKNR